MNLWICAKFHHVPTFVARALSGRDNFLRDTLCSFGFTGWWGIYTNLYWKSNSFVVFCSPHPCLPFLDFRDYFASFSWTTIEIVWSLWHRSFSCIGGVWYQPEGSGHAEPAFVVRSVRRPHWSGCEADVVWNQHLRGKRSLNVCGSHIRRTRSSCRCRWWSVSFINWQIGQPTNALVPQCDNFRIVAKATCSSSCRCFFAGLL